MTGCHDSEPKMVRICGKCQTQLTKENTGELQWLQSNCNSCTNPEELEKEIRLLFEKNKKRIEDEALHRLIFGVNK